MNWLEAFKFSFASIEWEPNRLKQQMNSISSNLIEFFILSFAGMHHNGNSCKRWTDEGQKDKIMIYIQVMRILMRFKMGIYKPTEAVDKILSLLDENTEGVSDAKQESCALHDVGDSHTSGDVAKESQASGELPLEKITDDGKFCPICGKKEWKYKEGVKVWNCSCIYF